MGSIKTTGCLLRVCSPWALGLLPEGVKGGLRVLYDSVPTLSILFCPVRQKVHALSLLSIFSPFYVKQGKGIFPSGWKCGTHIDALPSSEQADEQSLVWGLHLTQEAAFDPGGGCPHGSQALLEGRRISEELVTVLRRKLAVGVHPCSECYWEWFVRQRAVEVLTQGTSVLSLNLL